MDVLTIYTGRSGECDSASEDAGPADGGLLGRLGLPRHGPLCPSAPSCQRCLLRVTAVAARGSGNVLPTDGVVLCS